MIGGPDLSHYQSANMAQVAASGQTFVILKATEGTSYVDPMFAARRQQAHAAGLIVGMYHFARAGSAAAEAAFFLKTVGPLQPREVPVLDWEVPYSDPPGWSLQWLNAVRAATGASSLIYMNRSTLNSFNWSAVAAAYQLWLAAYDGSTTFPSVPYWGTPAMKQYSDKGTVPGVGTCDVNVFNGTADQLLAYGTSSTGAADMTPAESQMLSDVLANVLAVRQQDFVVLEEQVLPAQVATLLRAPAYDGGPQVSAVLAGLFQAVFQGGPSMPDGGESIGQSLADLRKALTTVQAPVIDEAKLAAALLADPASIAALGKAIADNLQLSPRQ